MHEKARLCLEGINEGLQHAHNLHCQHLNTLRKLTQNFLKGQGANADDNTQF